MKPKTPFWKPRSHKKPALSPTPRPRQDIQDDYNRACVEAGDIQYKLVSMSDRLDWLTKFRGALNEELAALEELEAAKRANAGPIPENLPTAPPRPEEQH